MSRDAGFWVRWYRRAASLLPPGLRDDRRDMADDLARLLAGARTPGARLRVLARGFGRLPAVIVVEWLEFLGARPAPGRNDHGRWGMGFARDVRFGLRTLRKAPAFTASAVLLMAVGVGMATAVFTLVDHVLLRPLPYPDADRLVYVDDASHSGPFFQRLAATRTVDLWAAAGTADVNLTGVGAPRRLDQASVTPDFFRLFGARPRVGRLLTPDDARNADAVVLAHGSWLRLFGGDPGVVGRTLRIDGEPVTVVGVVDASFAPPEALVGGSVDLWRSTDWSAPSMQDTDYNVLEIAGRRVEGAALAAVQEELDGVVSSMAVDDGNFRREDGSPVDVPVVRLADATVAGVRRGLGLMAGAVGLLLLVACANVAHLFLARGLGRVRELAVRRALGAGSAALTRQLLVESLLVALAGGLLGIGIAWGAVGAFAVLNPAALPRQGAVSVDLRVLGFSLGAAALTSLLFGLAPALRAARGQVSDQLRGGRSASAGRGVVALRHGLVVAEVALSLVLVASAGLLVRSFVSVRAVEPGFAVEGVWTLPLTPTGPESPAELTGLMDDVIREIAAVPGVTEAAYGLTMPLELTGGGRCCWRTDLDVEGWTGDRLLVRVHPVSDGYFRTLGIDLVAGRGWTEAEAASDPAPVVLGEPLARQVFGGPEQAVGRTLELAGTIGRVVGVAADHHHYGLEAAHGTFLYVPFRMVPVALPRAHVAVVVDGPSGAAVARALREAVWRAVPSLPVPTVRGMDEWLARSTAGRRFESALFGTFASVALLMAAGGLYGTLLFVAGQRRKELGIRLALGASRRRIEGRLLRSGVAVGAAGIVLGLLGAAWAGRLLESQIWGVERGDPATLAASAGILFLTAVLASWLPARRAGRTDPLETLRVE